MFYTIQLKKEELDKIKPLNSKVFRNLKEKTLIEWVNTWSKNEKFSLMEIKTIFDGIAIGGKPIKDHLKILNYKEAISYVDEIIKKEELLTEIQIKTIHSLLEKGEFDKTLSAYRNRNTNESGLKYTYVKYTKIKEEINSFLEWYKIRKENENIIERVVLIQVIFLMIQPFSEKNIRTSELLLNLELMKNNYPPIVIKNRVEYHEALEKACIYGRNDSLIRLVSLEMKETLDLYLKIYNCEEN